MKLFRVLAMAWLALQAGSVRGNEDVFRAAIAPIFERHCISCHEGAKPKGGLSLISARKAMLGGESGAAIVPGKPDESLLLDYISGEKPAMPKDARPLAAAEVAAIRIWIEAGATWPADLELADKKLNDTNWWSLQPLVRPEVPPAKLESKQASFPIRNAIDAFILAKLEQHQLTPSPEADRPTLIRRLYYDLIGLPPRPEEVQAFLADDDPQAYEKLVDRLLASPSYGERWGRHWLDVVHYGDTHGYDKDKPRPNAWPYRDYVIRSFNDDKPYAQFVQEQLAGDMLFPDTVDGITALGFISAGPWDFIGHAEVTEEKIDGKIARVLDRDDMVSNTMNTFTSATVQCARCHNHKFDPITQEDYYSLQAVFAALDRAPKPYDSDPKLADERRRLLKSKEQLTGEKQGLDLKIAKLAGPKLIELNEQIAIFSQPKPVDPAQAAAFGYHSQLVATQDTVKCVQVDLGQTTELSRVVLHPCKDDFNQIGEGFGFPVRFRVELSNDAAFKTEVTVIGDYSDADFPNPRLTPLVLTVSGESARYVRVSVSRLALRQNDYMFALAELTVWDAAGKIVSAGKPVTALDSIEAVPRWRMANLVDGYYPGETVAKNPADLARVQAERQKLLDQTVDAETRSQLASVSKALTETEATLAKLPPQAEVYAGTVYAGSGSFRGTGSTGGRPREIHVLSRGDVRKPLEIVGPGVPPLLPGVKTRFEVAVDQPEGERRVALAKWITEPTHPLTWRSIVNRVWQYHFGRGIVDTPNDFGRMGSLPSHPELLDWLAVEFRDGGQSIKTLHRLMCNSSTYRQSSENKHAYAALDSDNVFLWRMNRRRLEAEAIRDSVLDVAGKLDSSMGGPGFQDFVIERPEHSPHYEYKLFDPEDPKSHRRSVYRFIVRSQPQPFMTTLDCADPSMSVDKRNESISALQSLAMLNNKFMVTMAAHFAERLEKESPDISSRIDRAVWLCLGRAPTASEQAELMEYSQQFGLTNTCRILFNLNEFAFVD
jgi:hypothetical protein